MSSRVPESLDPDKLLLDLGWSDTGSARAAAGPARSRPARHYCSFCWTAIPDGDPECASCGRSLEEILAVAGKAAPGAGWKPTRLGGASTVPKSARPARVVALTVEPASQPALRASARPAMHPAAAVLLVAALLAASTMTGAYLGQLSVKSGNPADGPSPPPPKPRATPASSGSAVPIEWDNPHSELRLELVSPKGKVLAASDGEAASVPTISPGEYRLRTSAIEGDWHPVERTITVRAGEPLKLAPSPESVAEYFTFHGATLRNAGKEEEAKEAWRSAIQAAPTLPEPRLQLAESLITENRYSEAGAELRAVLDVSPDDPRAIRLLRRIREQSAR